MTSLCDVEPEPVYELIDRFYLFFTIQFYTSIIFLNWFNIHLILDHKAVQASCAGRSRYRCTPHLDQGIFQVRSIIKDQAYQDLPVDDRRYRSQARQQLSRCSFWEGETRSFALLLMLRSYVPIIDEGCVDHGEL
jgi:hypothetical protein